MGEGSTTVTNDPERFFRVVADTIDALDRASVPHAVIGSAAYAAYVDETPIEDLDVLVHPSHAEGSLLALASAGFRTERTDPTWLYKAWMNGVLVDVIFRPPRSFLLTEASIGRRRRLRLGGIEVPMLAPEDQVLLELASDSADAPWHWRSALEILDKQEIDWSIFDPSENDENGHRLIALLAYARTEGVSVPLGLISRSAAIEG